MNCDQVRELIGLYLDSELEARTAQEVREHLNHCPECAQVYRTEQTFLAALEAKLKEAAPTPSLWQAEEAFVARAFRDRAADRRAPLVREPGWGWGRAFWREFLWPSPAYYAGLSVVWAGLLVWRLAISEPVPSTAATPSRMSPATRLALLEQRRELRELLVGPEAGLRPPQAKALSPQSQVQPLPHQAHT